MTRLSSDNYHAWSIRARAALVQKGCWDAINPGFQDKMSADERKQDQKALTFLFLVVEDTYLDDIGMCNTAKDAWDTLEEMHSKFGLLHILQLMRDFFNIRKKDDEDMKSYLGRLMELNRKLKSSGYDFKDREVALVMLMGLPESYEALILNLEQDEDALSTKKVKTRLLLEEKRKLRREEELDNKPKAMAMQHKKKQYQNAEKKSKQSVENKSAIDGKVGDRRRWFKCYCCNKFGHIAKDCPEAQEEQNKAAEKAKPQAKMAQRKALAVTQPKTSGDISWYLDSACTDNMTSEREKMADFNPNDTDVEVANKQKIAATGSGKVKFVIEGKNEDMHITLNDVLCVPELNDNLISVGRLDELGYTITFGNGEAVVSEKDGEVVMTAQRRGRLYAIEGRTPSARIAKTSDLWHRRLGHLHAEATNKLMEKKIPEAKRDSDEECDTCSQAKLRRTSFPTSGASRATAKLELIHSDVVGKITPTTKGGSKYFVTFIDDYTRYAVVYPMKTKGEVLDKFDEYRRMVENLHGTTIKALRSDNGGEYLSKDFDAYLTKNGIRRQLTIPGTPQQNGVAERFNQTVLNATRCMLAESGVTKTLWADALDTACQVRNKCPSTAVDGKIPEEMWTGKEVRLDHLRVYGCRVWSVLDDKERRSKLDPKARECIFVGYPEGRKGYKLWDREKDAFIISRNVKFEEDRFPCKTTKEEAEELCIPTNAKDAVVNPFDDAGTGTLDELQEEGQLGEPIPLPQPNLPLQPAPEAPVPRRSDRIANQRRDEETHVRCPACMLTKGDVTDPTTLAEALAAPDEEEWRKAMTEEIGNMERNGTWTLVKRPEGRRVIRSKWVFKRKQDKDGNPSRYRARLVAQGFSQIEGIDYTETFSPVIKTKSIRTLLAIAVERKWTVHQMDITAAYLNGTLKETIYMEQPKPFDNGNTAEVCLLKKSLYGLKQSGREWNHTLDAFLKTMGMSRSRADPCVYIKGDLLVGVYVDDLLIAAPNDEIVSKFKEKISDEFEAKDLGEAESILNVRLTKHEDGSLTLDQKAHIKELLAEFGMDEARGTSSPLDPGTNFLKSSDPAKIKDKPNYRKAVGSLLYLANWTRPDIAHAAAYLSQFNENPTKEHWTGVCHSLRYLKKTEDHVLTYRRTGKGVEVFCDADWANDKSDRKSYSGYVALLAGGAISWRSSKQKTTALATVEAEYIAMVEAAKEVMWLQSFLGEINATELSPKPQSIFTDNQGAMCLANNHVTSERSKHIDLRHFFLREKVEDEIMKFIYVRSSDNAADLMTKALNGRKTSIFANNIGVGASSRGSVIHGLS